MPQGSATPVKVCLIAQEAWQPSRDAYISGEAPDPFGIYRVLEEHGITVVLFDPRDGLWNAFGRGHPIFRSLDPTRALKILLSQRDFHLLLSVFESSVVLILLARSLSCFRRPIVIWDVAPSETWRLGKLFRCYVWPAVNGFFLLSRQQAPYIKRRTANARCHFVGQHIDTEFYRPTDLHAGEFVLSVGDDVGRDFATYLSALQDERLAKERFIIRTCQTIRGKCTSNVEIIPDRMPYRALRMLYASAKFVVVPLHRCLNVSGVGTVLEAMAMGKAVIVSDSGMLCDYVVPGETCLVVEPENPNELRKAILYLLAHPAVCAKYGEKGRTHVVREFSHTAFGVRMASAIRNVLSDRR